MKTKTIMDTFANIVECVQMQVEPVPTAVKKLVAGFSQPTKCTQLLLLNLSARSGDAAYQVNWGAYLAIGSLNLHGDFSFGYKSRTSIS